MSPQSSIGSGSTIGNLLDAILRRLDSIEEKSQPLGRDLASMGGAGDGTLHADGSSGTHSTGNDDILAVGEGDDVLLTNDNNGALCTDNDSDVSSGSSGSDATTPVIGAIGVDSSLGKRDVLAAVGGGGNLDADTLLMGGADNSFGVARRLGRDRRRWLNRNRWWQKPRCLCPTCGR
jgi:hypothetical protein